MTILFSLYITRHELGFPKDLICMGLNYLLLLVPFIFEWILIKNVPGEIGDIPFFKEYILEEGCLIVFAMIFIENIYENRQLPHFILGILWVAFGLVRFISMLYNLFCSKEWKELFVHKLSYMFSGLLSIISAVYLVVSLYMEGKRRLSLYYVAVWTWLASKVIIGYSNIHAMLGLTSPTSDVKVNSILAYILPLTGMWSPIIDAVCSMLLTFNFNEFLLIITILKIVEVVGLISQYSLALMCGYKKGQS